MKFTVVIVTYNRLNLLKECIECILKQTQYIDNIVIVNNASTDGTTEYLEKYTDNKRFYIINKVKNGGGAEGFYDGLNESLDLDGDWIIVIDDDAMLDKEYVYSIGKGIKQLKEVQAFTGIVKTDGKIDIKHRSNLHKGIAFKKKYIEEVEYEKEYFYLDFASFCGLVINKNLVKLIGLPRKEYFIWHDDTEYSLRIRKHSKIANINSAILIHKTVINNEADRLTWKSYYGFRNKLDIIRNYRSKVALIYEYIRMFKHYIINICGVLIGKDKEKYIYNSKIYMYIIKDSLLKKMGKNENITHDK